MSVDSVRDLFDRWERVWHEGRYELIPECVADVYIRHDEVGTRGITRENYAAEIAAGNLERPNTRFVVYDHALTEDRAWFRFTRMWTDPDSGAPRTIAGIQVYRIEGGKLAETWLMLNGPGSVWPDAEGQERWTAPKRQR